jgi:CRP-like cAMP-binding protein
MHNYLLNHIKKYVAITPDDEEIITRYFQFIDVKKKTHLFTEGQKCNYNYFVCQGCLRLYFIKENGQEQIIQFGIDNWWITDYMNFEQHKPSNLYLQTIEPSIVAAITYSQQEELYITVPAFERYIRIITQKAYAATQRRMQFFFDLSGEEKYHHFNNAFPGFVQRIPQYMLASYLGFTPEFLSKIRAKQG